MKKNNVRLKDESVLGGYSLERVLSFRQDKIQMREGCSRVYQQKGLKTEDVGWLIHKRFRQKKDEREWIIICTGTAVKGVRHAASLVGKWWKYQYFCVLMHQALCLLLFSRTWNKIMSDRRGVESKQWSIFTKVILKGIFLYC